jgi:HSP20 family protein
VRPRRLQPARARQRLDRKTLRFYPGDDISLCHQVWVPALDVWETESELVYAVDLPGIPKDKISVELDEGALTISAERERTQEESQDRFYRFERRYGTFSRTFGVPQGVTDEDVSADCKDGVLEVHVRKPEQPQPKRIQVGSGAGAAIEGKAEKK